jgi:acyl-coenzyme A thioesterase PaaI-like protein
MKKLVGKQPNSKDCFICGLNNDMGLKASFFETDENEIVCIFTPPSEHQSYPGRLHGGVAAAVLDETIGRAVQIIDPDVWGVTAELKTCYKKPVPYNTQLRAVGRITSQNRLLFEGTGEIYTPDGEVAVTAWGKYVKMRIDNISEGFGGDDWKVYLDINDPDKVDL